MERFPCSPEMAARCATKNGKFREPFEDVHHRFYPENQYKDALGSTFRNLDENIELSCRCRHDEIHSCSIESGIYPERPSREIMALAVLEAMNKGLVHLSKSKKNKLNLDRLVG